MTTYDSTLDPISPDFDPRSWGDGPAEGTQVPLLDSERPGCHACRIEACEVEGNTLTPHTCERRVAEWEREVLDAPMFDEQGPLVPAHDEVRDLIVRFTTGLNHRSIAEATAQRLALRLGRTIDGTAARNIRMRNRTSGAPLT